MASEQVLRSIEHSRDVAALRQWIANAQRLGAKEVEDAAFRRLIEVSPADQPGTVEHDLWRTVAAFEHVLTQERKKTTRLSRTRQKLARVGVVQTLTDWANDPKETDGFNMLIQRGMPELTGEAIVLRHASCFPASVIATARERLSRVCDDENVLWPMGRT